MSPKTDDIESTSWWLNHPFDQKYAQVNLNHLRGRGKNKKNLWHHDHRLVYHRHPVEPRFSSTPKDIINSKGFLKSTELPSLRLTDLAPANMRLENYIFFLFAKKAYLLGAQHEYLIFLGDATSAATATIHCPTRRCDGYDPNYMNPPRGWPQKQRGGLRLKKRCFSWDGMVLDQYRYRYI